MTLEERISNLEDQITKLNTKQVDLRRQLTKTQVELWQARIDDLQVQLHLGAMETNEHLAKLTDQFRTLWAATRTQMEEASSTASDVGDTLRAGLESAYADGHPRGRWSRSGGDVEAPLDDLRQEQAQGGAGHDGERQGGQHGPGQGRDRRATSLRVVDARCAAHGTQGVATHLGASRGQGRADLGRRFLRRLRRSGRPDSVVGWSERTAMGGSDPRDERFDPRAG